jgi:hypothetical protein
MNPMKTASCAVDLSLRKYRAQEAEARGKKEQRVSGKGKEGFASILGLVRNHYVIDRSPPSTSTVILDPPPLSWPVMDWLFLSVP